MSRSVSVFSALKSQTAPEPSRPTPPHAKSGHSVRFSLPPQAMEVKRSPSRSVSQRNSRESAYGGLSRSTSPSPPSAMVSSSAAAAPWRAFHERLSQLSCHIEDDDEGGDTTFAAASAASPSHSSSPSPPNPRRSSQPNNVLAMYGMWYLLQQQQLQQQQLQQQHLQQRARDQATSSVALAANTPAPKPIIKKEARHHETAASSSPSLAAVREEQQQAAAELAALRSEMQQVKQALQGLSGRFDYSKEKATETRAEQYFPRSEFEDGAEEGRQWGQRRRPSVTHRVTVPRGGEEGASASGRLSVYERKRRLLAMRKPEWH